MLQLKPWTILLIVVLVRLVGHVPANAGVPDSYRSLGVLAVARVGFPGDDSWPPTESVIPMWVLIMVLPAIRG